MFFIVYVGHKGWVWGLAFSVQGSFLFSGSSDRSLKVFHMPSGGSCVTSLGGHLHRVNYVALKPVIGNEDQEQFVTGSLDSSLKVRW